MTSMVNRLVVSILGGVIVTLLTGLLPNTPHMLVGAVYYGFPIAWLFKMIVAPEYNPWRFDFPKFLADMIAWSVVSLVIVFILEKVGKPASK